MRRCKLGTEQRNIFTALISKRMLNKHGKSSKLFHGKAFRSQSRKNSHTIQIISFFQDKHDAKMY